MGRVLVSLMHVCLSIFLHVQRMWKRQHFRLKLSSVYLMKGFHKDGSSDPVNAMAFGVDKIKSICQNPPKVLLSCVRYVTFNVFKLHVVSVLTSHCNLVVAFGIYGILRLMVSPANLKCNAIVVVGFSPCVQHYVWHDTRNNCLKIMVFHINFSCSTSCEQHCWKNYQSVLVKFQDTSNIIQEAIVWIMMFWITTSKNRKIWGFFLVEGEHDGICIYKEPLLRLPNHHRHTCQE